MEYVAEQIQAMDVNNDGVITLGRVRGLRLRHGT